MASKNTIRRVPAPADDPILTPQEVAAQINVEVGTLYVWRVRRKGPQGFKAEGLLRYRQSAVNKWLAGCGDTAANGAR